MVVISETLAALHDQQKWHRDLHPGNLFLLADAPAIGDFGLIDFPGKDPVTGDTEPLGARNYIAPEMRKNAGQVRADKADVYSFAKTFWMLASGESFPPDGQLRMENSELRFSTYCRHERARILDSLMERSTDFEPGRRPTMREFSTELSEWLKIELTSTPVSLDLSELAKECRGVFESGIIAEHNQKRITLEAQWVLVSFNETLERMSVGMMEVTNLTPTSGDTYLNERFHIFPQHLGQAKVIWRSAREVRITTKIDPFEDFLQGYVQVEALSDNRIRILVGYLIQPAIHGQLVWPSDSWKKETIATVGSAQLMNDTGGLKVELVQNLPRAIREYVAMVKQHLTN
jgi:serine/threonine protein kinase